MKALSIRQPWAWLIIAGHKIIENRTWFTEYRGPFLVHAPQEVDHSALKLHKIPPQKMLCGGVIGVVELVEIIDKPRNASEREWWIGPYGWVLKNPHPVRFMPCKGAPEINAAA